MIRPDKIVEELLNNCNDTPLSSQKNLVSSDYYKKLCDEVLCILNNNKDASLNEIREILYKDSNLDSILRRFFIEQKKAPGAVIGYGTSLYQENIVIGNSQEVEEKNGELVYSPKEMETDSIFDLASVTKLFTSVAILQLAGEEKLRLDDSIKKYLPQFNNLGNHNIFNLLTYQPYYTEKRIDTAKSYDEAERLLFNARPYEASEFIGRDRYNDIAPMILKYIVEKVSGLNFWDYVKTNILDRKNMTNTFVKVPDSEISKVVNFNYFGKILNDGSFSLQRDVKPGIATDTKAVALGQQEGILSGHAGLFSTVDDMTSFERGLIDGTILHPLLTKEMAKARTLNDVIYSSGICYVPYYGFLCSSKHPNKYFSEVFLPLSGSSLSKTGWAGNIVTIDPLNDITMTFLSNRVHNRLVSYDGKYNYKLAGSPTQKKYIDEKGHEFIDASLYAFERLEITDACLELALKERILEEIVGRKEISEEKSLRKIK